MNPLLIQVESVNVHCMEDRINQLESLSALQDRTLAQLNEEMFRQQQQMALLQQRIRTVEERLKQLEQPDPTAGSEKPPHW